MFGFGKFLMNRRGAFAIQFALMVVPLTVCTGLAIDGGRAFLARFELESALDAAALAVGSTTVTNADLNKVAQTYVDANFKSPHAGPIALQLTPGDTLIKLHGTVTLNTYFMPLVGQPTVTVAAESQVVRGGANVEVAMALDITQSMNTPSTKIAALRVAAADLIDTVVNDVQTPYFSRVAIVPWGTNVNLGTYADAVRGPVTGTTPMTGANWRFAGTSTRTLTTGTGWRTNTGKSLSNPGVTWKNGSSYSISKITKVSSNTRIQVTTSSNPGYSNGDTVYITGAGGSYTGLNSNKYKVADVTTSSPYTFNLQNVGTTTYTTPPSGSTNSTAGTSQRCFTTACELQVTASSHGFSNGAYVNIMGASTTGTGTDFNNTATTTYTIGSVATNTFILTGTDGPSFKGWSSGGTASNCYVSDCRYQVTTTAAHGFSNNHFVFISGVTTTGSAGSTSPNTANNSSWTISGASGSVFYLPGTGNTYKDWGSGGSAYDCANSTCNVQVTSNGHGLNNNDWVEITGVGGLTGVNNSSSGILAWQVTNSTTNTFLLRDSTPALSNMANAYSANTGTAQCLQQGCQKLHFINANGGTNYSVRSITNCGTERVGSSAHTDDSPSVSYVGRDYSGGSGSLVTCVTGSPATGGNYLTPLTADKTALKKAITDMTVSGSTAGMIGADWAWYMLSPNWATVWPGTATDPHPYGESHLAKVAILMTDGAFNTAHCHGVTTESYSVTSISKSDRADSTECTAADSPFNQAQATCTAMKAAGIQVYTIGFEVGSEAGAADFLTACATDTNHVYLSASEDELKSDFKKIAKSISKLRISK
ncbi:MAG TPA: TadE/TadG family type IV pilus assembly protein [Hyphomonadaceae bacterium]|nr:TadE/TadG family type IV pilus assembly protein [Hyphomonadaceae bacterium]